MKLSATLSRLALAASILLLVGCPKKPDRPTAEMTALGPTTAQNPNGQPGGNRGSGGGVIFPGRAPGETPGSVIGSRTEVDPATAGRGVLASVLFAFDSSAITSAAERAKLQAAAKYLQDHPGDRLVLEGHCDWRGTAEYNLALGDRRAIAAQKILVSLNIAADRLEIVSKGSAGAKEKGATEAEMANDRRVEFVIVPASTAPRGGS